MFVGLVVGLWVAKYLGPSQFGLYSYAVAFSTLFSSFSTLGLESVAIRDIVRNPSKSDEVLGTVFCLEALGGLVGLLFVVGTIFLIRPNEPLLHLVVIVIAFRIPLNAFNTFDIWFQSQCQSKYTVFARLLAFLITSLIRILLITNQAPLENFAALYLLESIIFSGSVVLVYKFVTTQFLKLRSSASYSRAKNLLGNSWSLLISEIVIMLYLRIDQVMIGTMLGNTEVGIYSLAIRFTEIWYFIPIGIVKSVFPSIILMKEGDINRYYTKLQQLYNLVTWIAIVIVIFTQAFSEYFITTFLGSVYINSYYILSITIWAIIFAFQGVARGNWLVIENLQHYAFLYIGFGGIVNVVLNYVLIPIYGMKGAAVATVISQFTVAIAAPALFESTRISSYMMLKAFFPIKR